MRHGLYIHQYADDSQVYMSVSVSEARDSRSQLRYLRARRQRVDESQQTAAKPDQDPGHVTRLRPAAEACRHQRHPVVIDHRSGR